jgi:hypothetical protein
MKTRGLKMIFATVVVSLLVLVTAYSQEDMTHVDNSVYSNPQRTPSVFNHEAHNEAAEIEECNECHHVYEDGKKLEDESSEDLLCSDCHAFENEGRMPGLTKAFHTNCKGCHENKNKGPVMCGECHVKSKLET